MSGFANERTQEERALHDWLRRNRGIMKRIALSTSFSQSYVSDILHKRRRSFDGRVERLLKHAQAPGWAE